MPNMITIRETETEYLLYVPFPQKDRAKNVAGYRWDPERKCWVYLRTGRNYDALIAEFGDDLVESTISRPVLQSQSPDQESARRQEDESLRDDLARIQGKLEEIARSSGNEVGSRTTTELLKSKEREIELLQKRVNKLETELDRMTRLVSEAEEKAKRLTVQLSNATDQTNAPPVERLVKELAIQATGGEPKFGQLVSRSPLDQEMLITLAKQLEEELRRLLNVPDRKVSLYELIQEAKDANLLPDDAVSLAHIIRKQRNIVAHGDEYKVTYKARVLLSLFAASLLWPEFPE